MYLELPNSRSEQHLKSSIMHVYDSTVTYLPITDIGIVRHSVFLPALGTRRRYRTEGAKVPDCVRLSVCLSVLLGCSGLTTNKTAYLPTLPYLYIPDLYLYQTSRIPSCFVCQSTYPMILSTQPHPRLASPRLDLASRPSLSRR